MNERMKQLAEQAGMTDDKFGMYFAKDKHREDGVDLEKFAELIVKECEVALSPMLRDMISRGQAYNLIKQHFGVEE